MSEIGFVIRREGRMVGYTTDERLADHIDGMERQTEAVDPENQLTVAYTVTEGGE